MARMASNHGSRAQALNHIIKGTMKLTRLLLAAVCIICFFGTKVDAQETNSYP